MADPIKILVIDDAADLLTILRFRLSKLGYEVHGANNGLQGIEIAKKVTPHVILCDVMMPELDGYSVLEQVRAHPDLAKTPIIIMSALNQPVNIERARALGATAFVTKPIRPQHLMELVARALGLPPPQAAT